MAFQKMKGNETPQNQLNFITAGTYLEGTIETKGSLRIDGKVKGIIRAADDVSVGRNGEIVGELYAKTAKIAGKVEGNVYIEQKLTLQETSTLNGNLSAGKLVIDEGAFFNGKSDMGNNAGLSKNGKKGIFEKPGVTQGVAHDNAQQ